MHIRTYVVLTVLMSRLLDLETEDWELDDGQMLVTIFQYSSYFLSQTHGRYGRGGGLDFK